MKKRCYKMGRKVCFNTATEGSKVDKTSDLEDEMFRRINQKRHKYKLNYLRRSRKLDAQASALARTRKRKEQEDGIRNDNKMKIGKSNKYKYV